MAEAQPFYQVRLLFPILALGGGDDEYTLGSYHPWDEWKDPFTCERLASDQDDGIDYRPDG